MQHYATLTRSGYAQQLRGLHSWSVVSAIVQRAAAAASTAFFFSPAAFLATTLDLAACSAGAAALRIRGWASRVVLHLTGTLNWNA
jgi:hypothetical protein